MFDDTITNDIDLRAAIDQSRKLRDAVALIEQADTILIGLNADIGGSINGRGKFSTERGSLDDAIFGLNYAQNELTDLINQYEWDADCPL